MPDPDVRVRLTAEGVAEVVSALQKIQSEAAKTAKSASSGFGGLNTALLAARKTLGALGVAISIGAFSSMVVGAAEAAQSTLNLSQALGTSVEGARALGAAARRTGTDLSAIASSIGQFAKKTEEALRGDPASLGLFRAVGLTRQEIESFRSLDVSSRLELAARAFSRLQDGARKTELGIDLFGKKFKELIPIVNELGANGLPQVAVQLKETTLRAAAVLGDQLDDLKGTVRDLAIQFVGGLAPAVTVALRSIEGDLGANADAWNTWGQRIGKVLAGVLLSIENVMDSIHGAIEIATIDARAFAAIAGAIASKNFELIAGIRERAKIEEKAVEDAQRERANKRLELFQSIGLSPTGPPPPQGFGAAAAAGAANDALQRQAELRRAQIDRQLAEAKASLAIEQALEDRAHDEGLTSLREYYEQRRAIVAAGVNAEIIALQKRRVQVAADPSVRNQAAELEKIDGQIQAQVQSRALQIEQLNAREADEYRSLAKERLALDQKIFETRGAQHEASLLQIEQEVEKADELLAKLGVPLAEAASTLEALRSGLNAQAEFDLRSRDAALALNELDSARARIQDQVDVGLLSQAEGEARILALERERIVTLRELADGLTRAAQASGDPERIAQAQAFVQNVDQLELALRRVEDVGARMQSVVIDQLGQSFVQTFGEGEVSAIKFGSVFKSVLVDVSNALRRFLSQLLFARAVMAILGLARGGSSAGTAGIPGGIGDVSGPIHAAEGGYVPLWAGSPGRDSVPGLLMPGEYVVRAAAVARPGVLRALDALNRGSVHIAPVRSASGIRFASGGLVPTAGGAASGPAQAWIRLGLDRGLIAQTIRSPEGRQAILEVVEANPRAFGAVLGGR